MEVGLGRDVDSGVKGGKQDINCLFPQCMEITVELMLQVSHIGHAPGPPGGQKEGSPFLHRSF